MLATGSTDTVRNIRRGSNPRTDTLEAICGVLGVEIHLVPPQDGTGLEQDPPSLFPDPKPPEAAPGIMAALGLTEGSSLQSPGRRAGDRAAAQGGPGG